MRYPMAKLSTVLATFITLIVQDVTVDGIQVQINQGLLEGQKVEAVTGNYYYSFKGIPYAKPPVGDLRFKAPQEPESWTGVRDATEHGPVCPQVNNVIDKYIPGSEDCLFANVYTPNIDTDKLLPVVVFIHGGGFLIGSGNVDLYGPDFLVSELVVVTINHRLSTLGFLSLGTCEVPGNAGLKDQVAALKWVQNNIHFFGGDATNVALLGDTSGGVSVSLHLLSPMSKGLFHRAIVMSGVPNCDSYHAHQPVRRAFNLGRNLGFETKNATDLLQFLQTVDYNKLINITASPGVVLASEEITDILFKMQPFTAPVIEVECPNDNFLTEDPFVSMAANKINKADVMFSYSNRESLILLQKYVDSYIALFNKYRELFVPSKLLTNCTPDTVLTLADKIIEYYFGDKIIDVTNIVDFERYSSNANVVFDMQRFFRRWPEGGNIYALKFASFSERNYYGFQGAQYGIKGAAHLDIASYIFDPKSRNLDFITNTREYKMIEQITTAIINFVKSGNPALDCSWPQFNNSSLAYMYFDDNMSVRYAPDEQDYNFWKSIFEEANVPF